MLEYFIDLQENQCRGCHHTARRVQIQGNTMVTSNSKACVWFVQNFLLARFKVEAQDKSFDIERFNSAVSNIVSSHVENK